MRKFKLQYAASYDIKVWFPVTIQMVLALQLIYISLYKDLYMACVNPVMAFKFWVYSVNNMRCPLQTSELVDEVTCIVDVSHSLMPCIVFVYQRSERSLIFNYKKKLKVERVPARNQTRIVWVKGQTHNH